jgi:D-methionine transport system substrate-binding protein
MFYLFRSKPMKKTLAVLAAVLSLSAHANEKLVVGATPVPHAEILEFVKPALAAEGVDLDIKVFSDFIQPNLQLAEKNLDANYYQYRPFLDEFNATRKTDLVPVVGVHIEPFGAYSTRIRSIAELKDGASVAIPNDPVNAGRALVLLHEAGLLTLKDPSNTLATQRDIAANPRHLKIRELEGALLARAVNQVDLAFVFANYALEAGIDTSSALIVEKGKDLYVEYLVARPDNIDDPRIQKLAKALNSPQVRDFILTRYKGQIVPGF